MSTSAPQSTLRNYEGLPYWQVREEIRSAAQMRDDEALKELERLYPETFKQMSNQAANAMRGKRRKDRE